MRIEQNFGPHIEQNLASFERFVRQFFVVHIARGFRVERQGELFFPLEIEARTRKCVVAVAGAGAIARDVGA
jgi:hypothetical protein